MGTARAKVNFLNSVFAGKAMDSNPCLPVHILYLLTGKRPTACEIPSCQGDFTLCRIVLHPLDQARYTLLFAYLEKISN